MRLIAFCVLFALTGCGGVGYLAQHYSTDFAGSVPTSGGDFSVTHSTTSAAFVTQQEAGAVIGTAVVSGATFGGVSRTTSDVLHEEAARAVLAAVPGCRLTASSRVEQVTVEHRYECASGRRLSNADLRAAASAIRGQVRTAPGLR